MKAVGARGVEDLSTKPPKPGLVVVELAITLPLPFIVSGRAGALSVNAGLPFSASFTTPAAIASRGIVDRNAVCALPMLCR